MRLPYHGAGLCAVLTACSRNVRTTMVTGSKAGVTREKYTPRHIYSGLKLAYSDLTPSTPDTLTAPPPPTLR